MDARAQRGLELAANKNIRQRGNLWIVPSQSGDDAYTVDYEAGHCTCPDHTVRQKKCKHLYAVEYVIQAQATTETKPDGTTTTTTTVTETKRVTYKQNWTAYNAAQQEEKTRFVALLATLCHTVVQPEQGKGRPRLPLSDMLFACAFKVYSGFSSRRFTSDLRDAFSNGFIGSTPHFNSVSNYLADENLTPLLKHLITLSSLPLRAVETHFAVDSTGFSTCRFVRWYDKKYGKEVDVHEWMKLRFMTGVVTNVVTSAEVSGWAANDSPFFKPLVQTTADHFDVDEVSADKAYLSYGNLKTVENAGGTAFIPFKTNTATPEPGDESVWARMYHYFSFNREQFLDHYHKRSNVESSVSMIKGKFGDAIRSKSHTGQMNEALCKVLCHNIYVLIQSIHELGIEPVFAEALLPARKSA